MTLIRRPPIASGGTATLRLAVDHPTAAGHFPGNPIIPGAVLLREIVMAISGTDNAARCHTIRFAKFRQPIRPGDTIVVSWAGDQGGEIRFSCSIAGSARPAVTGALSLSPP
jgi:3-hydroxymyristoyl/3-hydroxydecanoyl-(acyl carrier protein) dehydratase